MKKTISKKKIILIVAIIAMIFVITGCTVPTDPETNEPIYITLNTTFKDMQDLKSGIFDVVLTYPLAQAINFCSSKEGLGLGVFGGITIVTLLLNLILLVFTFKSNVSMQKMQMIQPELEKIQKKYEGQESDAAKMQMSQEMQRLFEKNGVNPLASFASFLQLPILLCMYAAIRRSVEVANGTFLGVSLAHTPKDAFGNGEVVLIVIYVCMIVFQLLSSLFPQFLANMKKKREAEIHHKPYEKTKNSNAFMMYGLVAVVGFAMLNWPTALSLYYAIVSVINILKTIAVEIIMQKKGVNK